MQNTIVCVRVCSMHVCLFLFCFFLGGEGGIDMYKCTGHLFHINCCPHIMNSSMLNKYICTAKLFKSN